MSELQQPPVLVRDNDLLASLCRDWHHCPALAVDTEFERSRTFFPIPALLQINDGDRCYLIDPLTIDELAPLRAVFDDPAVVKVLHAPSEDLEVFRRLLGTVPAPLFDTQLAAAFAGMDFSMGYARLVQALLGVELPKGETRSDWLQRPLSQAQIEYAALDVLLLLPLYQQLREQLAGDKLRWLEADCAAMLNVPDTTDTAVQKVKLAWQLDRRGVAILQALSQWREAEARARDVPRNRLLKEQGMWEIAQRKPAELRRLGSLPGVPPRTVRTDGESLLAMVEAAQALPRDQLPETLPPPLPIAAGGLIKTLRAAVQTRATDLGMAPELLARKRDFEALVRSGWSDGAFQRPAALDGWRETVIGNDLVAVARDWWQQHQAAGAVTEQPD